MAGCGLIRGRKCLKTPCTLEKTGAQLSNFLKAKKNNGFIFSCPSKVAQLLLSIFAIYKTRESVPQILISFPVAGYFLLRPDSGTQVFLKSLKPIFQTPNRTGSFPVAGFFATREKHSTDKHSHSAYQVSHRCKSTKYQIVYLNNFSKRHCGQKMKTNKK